MAYQNGDIVSVRIDGKVYKEVNVSGRRVIQVPFMPHNIDIDISGKPLKIELGHGFEGYVIAPWIEIESLSIGKGVEPLHFFKGKGELVNQHKWKESIEWCAPFNPMFKVVINIKEIDESESSLNKFEIYFSLCSKPNNPKQNNLRSLLEFFDKEDNTTTSKDLDTLDAEIGREQTWEDLTNKEKEEKWNEFFEMLIRFNQIVAFNIEGELSGEKKRPDWIKSSSDNIFNQYHDLFGQIDINTDKVEISIDTDDGSFSTPYTAKNLVAIENDLNDLENKEQQEEIKLLKKLLKKYGDKLK